MDQFQQFLEDEGAKEFFKENLEESGVLSLADLLTCVPDGYIAESFSWAETEQGFDFWDSLSDKWYDYCVRHGMDCAVI